MGQWAHPRTRASSLLEANVESVRARPITRFLRATAVERRGLVGDATGSPSRPATSPVPPAGRSHLSQAFTGAGSFDPFNLGHSMVRDIGIHRHHAQCSRYWRHASSCQNCRMLPDDAATPMEWINLSIYVALFWQFISGPGDSSQSRPAYPHRRPVRLWTTHRAFVVHNASSPHAEGFMVQQHAA